MTRFGLLAMCSTAVVLLLALACGSWRSIRQTREASVWISQTQRLQTALERLASTVADAEAGQRGYLLTGDERHLKHYTTAMASIEERIGNVQSAIGNPDQRQVLARLGPVIRERMQRLVEGVELRRQSGLAAAVAPVVSGAGSRLMEQIRTGIRGLQEAQARQLERRIRTRERQIQTAGLLINIGFATAIAFIGVAAAFLYRHLSRRDRTEQMLARLGARLEERVRERTAELAWAEERFRATFEQAPVGIAHMSTDGTCLWVNDSLCRIVGYPREELLRLGFDNVTHPEDRLRDGEGTRAVLRGETPGYQAQTRYLRQNGSSIWANLSVSLARTAFGEPMHLIAVVEDISAQKAAETGLREREERFRFLADAIPEMVWTTNARGHLEYCNKYWQLYTSFELSGTERWRWTSALHSDDVQPCIRAWRAALRTGDPFTLQCRYVRAADGSPRWHSVRVSPRRNESGEIVQWIGTAVDIDDQKRINQQLERAVAERTAELHQQKQAAEEANRAKSSFLANMSHELRTPLNSILGFTEILEDELAGRASPEHVDFLRRVHTSAAHLLHLINDLLDLAKVEAGRMHPRPCWFDAAAVVSEVVAELQPLADKNGLTVEVALDGMRGQAWADPLMARQVLYNYLSNALKFTPAGGIVSVNARQESAGELRLAVSDTGPGIEAAATARLFRKFEQLDNTVTKKHAGTGLGLALVKNLVELHGGNVGVQTQPGKGSTFVANFPGARPRAAAAREEAVCA